jgi:uncharacterized Zn finger protein (UPF0148 family)
MNESALRLGDLIDDYCPRCRLLLNHAVASMIEGNVVKVICQTCYSEHAYHHGKERKKKPGSSRATLFEQVLASAAPQDDPPTGATKKKRTVPSARYISRHKNKSPGRKT